MLAAVFLFICARQASKHIQLTQLRDELLRHKSLTSHTFLQSHAPQDFLQNWISFSKADQIA